MPHLTLVRRLGERWSRLLDAETAALYLGKPSATYVTENAALCGKFFDFGGHCVIDRRDLDEYIDEVKAKTRDPRA